MKSFEKVELAWYGLTNRFYCICRNNDGMPCNGMVYGHCLVYRACLLPPDRTLQRVPTQKFAGYGLHRRKDFFCGPGDTDSDWISDSSLESIGDHFVLRLLRDLHYYTAYVHCDYFLNHIGFIFCTRNQLWYCGDCRGNAYGACKERRC